MDITSILEKVDSEMFGIWFLIGAALVFFMQCGFAMVETGFTRAKNAGNIIMKNLMDFCIGTPMFILLGFGLMMGEEVLGGFCGMPTLGVSQIIKTLIGQTLCLTLCSVLQRQLLFPVQWRSVQSFQAIVFIRQ